MLEVIKKRRSIRKYQDKPIEEEKLKEILRAAMFAPSAMHRRPWQFWVVKDKSLKEKLSLVHQWAGFIAQAPVCLVVGSVPDRRWVEDCAIISSYVYLEATNQGVGTCFIQIRDAQTMEGKDCEEYVKKVLNIPEKIRILCLMPIGYPAEIPPEHSEAEFEEEKIHKV